MIRSKIAGPIHSQYRFAIAPGVEVHPGRFYSFDTSGLLVKPEDSAAGRRAVFAQERATGNATGTRKALCAVSVIALIPKGTLTAADRGRMTYVTAELAASTTDNGKPCGLLLDVDETTAAIKIG